MITLFFVSLRNNYLLPIFPIFRLTKSKKNITGSLTTYFFLRNFSFFKLQKKRKFILIFSFLKKKKKYFFTKKNSLLFYKGEPLILKTIFLFKNFYEWYYFLNNLF